MLVIGRRIGEVVYVEHGGETLAITIEEVSKFRKFRLGFTGPKSFVIRRDDARQQKKERADGVD